MIEQIFELARGNEKAVEKVVFDENVNYLHMIFNKDEGLPEHFSNSNVYMTVIRGKLTIGRLTIKSQVLKWYFLNELQKCISDRYWTLN